MARWVGVDVTASHHTIFKTFAQADAVRSQKWEAFFSLACRRKRSCYRLSSMAT
jgi:hypothetical protein